MEGNGIDFKQEVLDSEIPVLVDFWADWCAPCKMIEPAVMEIAKENEGRLKIVRINVDENQNLAVQYGIMSIPTLAIFVDGVVVDKIIGAVPKRTILTKIEKYISTN
ncbi:MAG: thioredoxin [Caldisericaceae bacterium]|nr:thioredoxin [Caldisericaceae bacterium]